MRLGTTRSSAWNPPSRFDACIPACLVCRAMSGYETGQLHASCDQVPCAEESELSPGLCHRRSKCIYVSFCRNSSLARAAMQALQHCYRATFLQALQHCYRALLLPRDDKNKETEQACECQGGPASDEYKHEQQVVLCFFLNDHLRVACYWLRGSAVFHSALKT